MLGRKKSTGMRDGDGGGLQTCWLRFGPWMAAMRREHCMSHELAFGGGPFFQEEGAAGKRTRALRSLKIAGVWQMAGAEASGPGAAGGAPAEQRGGGRATPFAPDQCRCGGAEGRRDRSANLAFSVLFPRCRRSSCAYAGSLGVSLSLVSTSLRQSTVGKPTVGRCTPLFRQIVLILSCDSPARSPGPASRVGKH